MIQPITTAPPNTRHIILIAAALIYSASPLAAAADEVFLTCSGTTSTVYAGGGPSTQFPDDKISVKIDVDNHMFSWSPEPLPTTVKSCIVLKDMTDPLTTCSHVIISDLKYEFQMTSALSVTHGTIDRVTGELFAKTDQYEAVPNGIPKPHFWVTRIMNCVPAARQF
jgi:hypothetical protein